MNEESIRKRIRVLLDEIHNEADPVLLNRCRSIFRQEVSFFSRSYLAAYLLLLEDGSIEGKTAAPSGKSAGRSGTAARFSGSRQETGREFRSTIARPDAEMSPLSEEESVRLFVSIGRNRKVFPREILALINARAKVAREDIGTIRILDNYSFVQVRNSAADTVIEALNGQSFRGRTLTVNYARTRREEETIPEDMASP